MAHKASPGEAVVAYIEQFLAPALRLGDNRGDGQSRNPQGRRCGGRDPRRGRQRPLPARLQPRPEPDREDVRQVESAAT